MASTMPESELGSLVDQACEEAVFQQVMETISLEQARDIFPSDNVWETGAWACLNLPAQPEATQQEEFGVEEVYAYGEFNTDEPNASICRALSRARQNHTNLPTILSALVSWRDYETLVRESQTNRRFTTAGAWAVGSYTALSSRFLTYVFNGIRTEIVADSDINPGNLYIVDRRVVDESANINNSRYTWSGGSAGSYNQWLVEWPATSSTVFNPQD